MFFTMILIVEKDSVELQTISQPVQYSCNCSFVLPSLAGLWAPMHSCEAGSRDQWLGWWEQPSHTSACPTAPRGCRKCWFACVFLLMKKTTNQWKYCGEGTQRAGFRECEHEHACVSASSQSGSCRVHGVAQLDCIDSQDRDHLGNKYLRNGSVLMPFTWYLIKAMTIKLHVFWLCFQSTAVWAAHPIVDLSLCWFRVYYMKASQTFPSKQGWLICSVYYPHKF